MASRKAINTLVNTLRRYAGDQWCVSGHTMQHFVKHGCLSEGIDITVANGVEVPFKFEYVNRSRENPLWIDGTPVRIMEGDVGQVIKEFVPEYRSIKMNFPHDLGRVLDEFDEDWYRSKSSRTRRDEISFFTTERRKEAHEQIHIMQQCAEKVGILDKMFLGFGGLLGYAWCSDFMPMDDDIDMCFIDVAPEQRMEYLQACKDAGLCDERMKGPQCIDGEISWFSIGRKPIAKGGVKSCNWFWFNHGGYWWHSKGKSWSLNKESHPKYSTSKGIPERIFTGELVEAEFGGNRIRIPKNVGQCLDWWYPGWILRAKGSSSNKVILVHPNESNKDSWYIERR